MSRGSRVWLALAVVFVVVNVLGVGYAVALHEVPHACIHAGLALLGAVPVWRLTARGSSRRAMSAAEAPTSVPRDDLSGRLARLEQSVDSVAIEVERIGEGQRYVTRLFTDRGRPQPVGTAAAGENGDAASPPDGDQDGSRSP